MMDAAHSTPTYFRILLEIEIRWFKTTLARFTVWVSDVGMIIGTSAPSSKILSNYNTSVARSLCFLIIIWLNTTYELVPTAFTLIWYRVDIYVYRPDSYSSLSLRIEIVNRVQCNTFI